MSLQYDPVEGTLPNLSKKRKRIVSSLHREHLQQEDIKSIISSGVGKVNDMIKKSSFISTESPRNIHSDKKRSVDKHFYKFIGSHLQADNKNDEMYPPVIVEEVPKITSLRRKLF